MADLDLFSSVGSPDWIHVQRAHPALNRDEEYRIRVVQHPVRHVEVEVKLRPGQEVSEGGDGWAPIRWHKRIREIAALAGVDP